MEWLEQRYLLAVAVELNGGPIPQFTGDAANDAITLRVSSSGNIEYSANGSAYTADLDSDPGVQSIPLSLAARIDLTLGAGNDALTLDFSGGKPIPAGGITYTGGFGTDQLIAATDASFMLSNSALVVSGAGSVMLNGVEQARLTGGSGPNVLDASAFTYGSVTLDGAAGNDTLFGGLVGDSLIGGAGVDRVVQTANVSQSLSNSILTGMGSDSLSGIEEAALTGGSDNNVLDAGAFGGPVTLDGAAGNDSLIGGRAADFLTGGSGNDTLNGGAGNDTLAENADLSFVLSNSALVGLGTDALIDVDQARLIGGPSANVFTMTDWTGSATLDGGAATDRVVMAGDANFILTPSLLSSSRGQAFILQSIDETQWTGGMGNNTFDASTFVGAVTLNGGDGNDWLLGGSGSDELSGGPGSDTIDGGGGTDTLVEMADADLTLSNASLTGAGGDALARVERARLTAGPGNNRLDALSFSGSVTLDGGAGNDTLLAGSFGSVLTGGSGSNILTGGAGTDTVVESTDANFTLSNGSYSGAGSDALTSIEQARLTGGVSANVFVISGWTGAATLDGGLGDDTVVSSNDANFTLTDTLLSRSGGGSFALVALERAQLTGGPSANTLNASAFTRGSVTLDGAGGDDTLQGSPRSDALLGGSGIDRVVVAGDASYSLANTSLSGLGTDTLNSVEQASLTGGPGPNSFTVGDWTGQATLDGAAGGDRVISSNNSSYTLSNSLLTQSNGASLQLRSIEEASLTGDANSNAINAASFSGSTSITGGAGNDTITGGTGTDTLIEQGDVNLTLNNSAMTGLGSDALSGIERAVLTGGPGNNLFDAHLFTGPMTLDGGAGADLLVCGPGSDILTGGPDGSNDTLIGGAGTDMVVESEDVSFAITSTSLTGLGSDSLNSIEQVRLTGGASSNVFTVSGWVGVATLDGGDGDDQIVSSNDANFVLSDSLLTRSTAGSISLSRIEQAKLTGGGGPNLIDASSFNGATTLDGAAGSDTLLGGAGADQLTGGSGSTNDTLNGGAGTDTVVESGNVNFVLTNATLTGLGTDSLSSIEQASLTGGSNGNTLNASAFTVGPVTLDGGSGGDSLIGGAWADVLSGGSGNDCLSGGAGTDTVRESVDANFTLTDSSLLGNGTDSLASVEQAEFVGGASSDLYTVSGWTGRATIDGAAGIDRIIAAGDANYVLANAALKRSNGGTIVLLNMEEASLTGGAASNSLDANGFSGNTTLDGGSGNDTMLGGMGNDSLIGGTGTDRVIAAGDVNFSLNDISLTGLGTDALGGIEEVLITGGDANNVFTISSFSGQATLDGGNGTDQIVASDNANFTLSDSLLIRSGGGTYALRSFEQGRLTGGSGANSLNASGFNGPVTLDGGSGTDSLVGGSGSDQLTGGPGGSTNDMLDGGPGIDALVETGDVPFTLTNTTLAGLGNDSLANIERAVLTGGSGNKALNASGFTLGPVTIDGGGGADTITGGADDDVLTGNLGNDVINGGPGADTLVESGDVSFTLSNTTLSGVGNDSLINVERVRITGGSGGNTIDGSAFSLGPVTLDGGAGNDTLKGGVASSTLIGGLGDDSLIGGIGTDCVVESADVDFTLTVLQLVGLGTDTLSGIEAASLTGGASANTLNAQAFSIGPVTLDGGGGKDTLWGGIRADSLVGGDGADSVSGGAGNDTLSGGPGDDFLDGGADSNVLAESADVDFTLSDTTLLGLGSDVLVSIAAASFMGGPGDNLLDASSFSASGVTLRGGSGNDTLAGSHGSDNFDGGPGNDTFRFGSSNQGSDSVADAQGTDTLDFSRFGALPGGPGLRLYLELTTAQTVHSYLTLTLASGTSIENVTGSSGNDIIVGNSLDNSIFANGGNDTIDGAAGNDTLSDGTGEDSVIGGPGNDVVYGVVGDDTLSTAIGDDTFYGGLGDFNGDGHTDAVGRNLATGEWRVQLGNDSEPIVESWGTYDPTVKWDEVQIGDFNADGRDDLAGRNATGLVKVALSTGSAFEIAGPWGVWDAPGSWRDIQVGDLNNDGLDDLMARNNANGDLMVSVSFGSGFTNAVWGNWPVTSSTIVDARLADLNGDGKADVAARNVWPGGPGQPGIWQVALSNGNSFTTQNWGTALAWTDVRATDANADGVTDLIGHVASSNDWWVALSKGSTFEVQNWGNSLPTHDTFGVSVPETDADLNAALDAFEYVRNNIAYQPYPGLMKGARATDETRAGNDWDQAALLHDRLEQAGISAQLVTGRVKFQGATQFQKVQGWLGVTRLDAALNVLAEAGQNVTCTTFQNNQVVSFNWNPSANSTVESGTADTNNQLLDCTIDHTWVKAYLPHHATSMMLDPSWKFKDYQAGVPNIVAQVPFNLAGFLAQPRPEIAYEYYENQVIDYLKGNLPGVSLAEIPRDGPIIAQAVTKRPPSPDYTIVSATTTAYDDISVVPATRQHRVRLILRSPDGTALLQQSLLVPTVSLDRITVSYANGSGDTLIPELRLDGTLFVRGSPVAGGAPVELTIDHFDPGDDAVDQSFTYHRKAGQYLAVGLNAQQISEAQLLRMRRDLNETILALDDEPTDPGEAAMGGTLALAMAKYFHDVSGQSDILSGLTHATSVYNRVGSGIATSDAQASYHWNLQIPVTPQGMGVDIPNNVYEPVPLHESSIAFDSPDQRTRLDLVGYNMSANEHAVLEEIINTESISTVKGIQIAHASGMPIQKFSPGEVRDIATPLHLSPAMEQAVAIAVNAGYTATVPQDPIKLHDWNGAVFLQENVQPNHFSLGYIIEDDLITRGGAATTPQPDAAPPVASGALAQQYSAGDPVNPSNGNMFRDEVDFTMPGIGLPLQFARHYDSQSNNDIGLGVGWIHTFGDFLSFSPGGDITWTQGDGTRHTFQTVGQGAYIVPATLHGSLTVSGGMVSFRNKDGLTHEFDSSGRLSDVADRNGNKLLVSRNSVGQIDTVSELHDPSRKLTFKYAGDHIASVQDFTGRTWTYSYQSMTNPFTFQREDFLAQVRSPSDAQTAAAIVQYHYTSGGKLYGLIDEIIEPDGSSHHYTYYPNRRAFEVTDALGHVTALSYDLFRNLTTFTNERGATTSYQYDDDGLLLKQTNPDQTSDSYEWQDFLMRSWTDPFGNTETYEFVEDGLANLKRTVDRAGRITEFTYEPIFSNVTSITVNPGPEQQTTQFSYDASGNVSQVLDAMGNRTTTDYSGCTTGSRGQVCGRTAPKGNASTANGDYTIRFAYNNAGQLLTTTSGQPAQAVNRYDNRGNLLTTTDPTGVQINYTYDLLGRRLTTALPDPDASGPLGTLVTTTSYDTMGRPLTVTDPNGNKTAFVYDPKGELTETIYPDGTTERYEWDPAGNRSAVIDELGRRTEWLYDELNRPVQTFFPGGATGRVRYDGGGRVIATFNPLGHSTASTYDPVGRLLIATDALGNSQVNTYDAFGNLKTATDRRGAVTTYVYDRLNRPTQVRGPEGFVSTTDYDPNGNVTRQVRYDFTNLGNIPDDPRTLPAALQRVQQTVYDLLDRPVQHIDALNNSSYVGYDAAGRVTTQQDSLGRVGITNYDAAGRVKQQIAADPDGPGPLAAPVTSYTLDAAGNVLTEQGPLNHITTSVYDGLNRTVKRYDAAGSMHSYFYDVAGQLTSEQDEAGRTTLYSYDQRGRRIRQILPDPDLTDGMQVGPVTVWSFDAAGNLVNETNALGRVTRFEYDALGRRTRQTLPDPDGPGALPAPLAASIYDAEGSLIRTSDELQRVTVHVNDLAGRTVQTIAPDPDGTAPLPSPVNTATYDALGILVRTADTLGRPTQYLYDALNRRTQTISPDPDGAGPLAAPITSTTFDPVGNVIGVTDPMGHTTTYQYDRLNRRTRETLSDPDGAGPLVAPYTTFSYDAAGNLLSSTNALGETTQNEYDSLDRLKRVVDPRLGVTSYAYDPVGNRIGITDPDLNKTTFAFDRLDRLTRETDASGASRVFSYDAAGNELSVTDRNGRVRQFSYDALNRVTAERWVESGTIVRTISTSYDDAGLVQSVSDPSSSVGFSYDALGRTIGVSNAAASGGPIVTWNYSYDAAGNRTARGETIDGQAGAMNAYAFDDLDRMTRIQQSGSAVAPKRIDLAYNGLGQIVSIGRSADLAGTQAVAQSSYGYDQANRLTSLLHAQGAATLAGYTYQFDAANRISQARSVADSVGTSNYSYDAAGQLISAAHSYQPNESYSYDSAGNRVSAGYQTGSDNQLNSDGTYTYSYDGEGNRTRRTRISTGDYVEYAWDHRNRLTRVTSKTASGTVTQQVDYTYDALDRRISRTVDADGSRPASAWRDYFVFDDDDVALIFRDPDASGPQPSSLSSRLLHGPAVDQILADDNSIYGVLWPLTDHEGTVRDLALRVGASTQVQNHLVYDSFGRVITETAPSVDHLFSYTGRERDEATGLLNYRARWYDPAVGRFLSEDPAGFAAGDANLSRYVANNPINATDPSGLRIRMPDEEIVHSSRFNFSDAGGQDVTCFVCSDGSLAYFNGKTLAPGHMETTAFGQFFIEGDAKVTRAESIEGTWAKYDADLKITGRQPSFWERIGVSIGRTLLPDSDPDIVLQLSDGTRRIVLGGGPHSGQVAGQAAALTGVYSAASTGGVAGVGRELVETIVDTAFNEATGIPLPIAGPVGDRLLRRESQVLQGVGRWDAQATDGSRITRLQLADSIDGITAQSAAIAREIRSGNAGVNILGDEMFARAYELRAGTRIGLDETAAFAYERQMYLRRSSSTILADTVHEGTHVLDHIGEFSGSVQQWERRAWLAEREYLGRLGLPAPTRNVRELLLGIWHNYPQD